MAFEPATPKPEEVAFLQGWLRAAGHYQGPETTEWTPELREALIRFQIDRGIGTSGRVDAATRAELMEGLAFVSGGFGNSPQHQLDLRVIQTYGPGAAAYLSDPEMGAIMRQAVADPDGTWDDERLMGALQNTEYFKRSSQAARAWDDLNLNDPEEANRRRRVMQAQVYDKVQRLGLVLGTAMVQEITEDALRDAWDDGQITNVITGFLKFDKGNPEGAGSVQADIARLKDMARNYHLKLPDEQFHAHAVKIAKGETTLEAVTASFRQQAKARYSFGDLPAQIDAGITPEEYFGQYRQNLARELEISPESIDFTDPKWSKVADYVDPNGVRRPMTVSESTTYARTQPEWDYTRSANERAAELALFIGRSFGATG